jgi:hypothetical protein
MRTFVVASMFLAGSSALALAQCSESKGTQAKPVAQTASGSCDQQTGKSGRCSAQLAAAGCCSKKDGAALASMPMLRCVVGEQETRCPIEAQKLAAGKDTQIEYFLGETKYTEMDQAVGAWQRELNRYLEDLTTVKYGVGDERVACPVTAGAMAKKSGKPVQYRLASYSFETSDRARKAAEAARKAADEVKMIMKVDGKEYACPKSASAEAGACGKSVQYFVAGQNIENQTQADVMLSIAKIQAATAALSSAAG